jgi:hypothetical protein
VTYETFRDMGIAFAVALVLIYMLVVWEFGNFTLPAIVVAPIPLTLIGIIPGHWMLNAEFTATSMIGFIALAGIIVRNSILLVDFSKHEIARGVHVVDAVINACKTRTRPIVITALALVAGSSVILFDPIFQGMAVSLLFGVLISTLLTLLVIPLGCISGRKAFGVDIDEEGPLGSAEAVAMPAATSTEYGGETSSASAAKSGTGRSVFSILYYIVLYVFVLIKDIIVGIFGVFSSIIKIIRRTYKSRLSTTAVSSANISTRNGHSDSRVSAQGSSTSQQNGTEHKISAVKKATAQEKGEPVPKREAQKSLTETTHSSSIVEVATPQKREPAPRQAKPKKKVSINKKPVSRKSSIQKTVTSKGKQANKTNKENVPDTEVDLQRTYNASSEEEKRTIVGEKLVTKKARPSKPQIRKGRRGIRLKKDILDDD